MEQKTKVETKLKDIQEDLVKKFKEIEEEITDFSIDQLKSFQSKLVSIEEKLKEKQKKVKTITISEEAHNKIKKYCVEKDLKINEWVESKLIELIK